MRPTLALAFIALAVAAIGIAYAAWTEQLKIQSNIDTGVLDVQLALGDGSQPDQGNPATETSSDQITDVEESNNLQDVAQTKVYFTDYNSEPYGMMVIEITNAYPANSQLQNGYGVTINAQIKNVGSVPARITGINAQCEDASGNPTTDVSISVNNIGTTTVIQSGASQSFTVTINTANAAEDSNGANDTSPDYICYVTIDFENYVPSS